MNRRRLLAALVVYGVCIADARAQREPKVWRVGFLAARTVTSLHADPIFHTFLPAMRELGYAEGRNLVIELRYAEGDAQRLAQLASELAKARVDVIVATGATAVRAAQKATSTIPIVMGTAGDPVGAGFVKSLARPGGNITGLTDVAADMGFKLLDVLLSAAPGIDSVAVLHNPTNPSHPAYVASLKEGAGSRGVRILQLAARSASEIEAAFAAMAKEKVRGLVALPDPVFNNRPQQIATLAAAYRLPCVSGYSRYVHAGGLMNYGPDFADNVRRAAAYVDRIFKGANPAEMPVEQSARFTLAVNLTAAKTLGLTIPQSVLIRADEVIQ